MTLKSHNMTSENPDENQVARAPSDQPEESARREFIAKAVSVFAGGAIVSVPIGVGVATLLGPAFKEGQGGTNQTMSENCCAAVGAAHIPRGVP